MDISTGRRHRPFSTTVFKVFHMAVVFTILLVVYWLKFGYHPHPVLFSTRDSDDWVPHNSLSLAHLNSIPQKSLSFAHLVTSTTSPLLGPSSFKPSIPVFYSHFGRNDNRSVFLVPRRVYFDTRWYNGGPRNRIMIACDMHDDAVATVVACEVNGEYSRSIKLYKEDMYWERTHKPGHTHMAVVIECVGLPLQSIVNGTFAKVVYKRPDEKFYSVVKSEKPLMLPKTPNPKYRRGSVVVCSTLYGHPPLFDVWLRYQKTLNVDRVHLNVDSSFLENATHLYPFLKESLANGFVHIERWNNIVGSQRMYYYGQITKYQDCIYRHIGAFDYVLLLDYDDFFNPQVPNQGDIHFYIHKLFASDSTGTVHIPWHQMKCKAAKERTDQLLDGNLTSVLSGFNSTRRTQCKCAHKLSAALFVSVHTSRNLLPGYGKHYSLYRLAYVAHNRINNKMCVQDGT